MISKLFEKYMYFKDLLTYLKGKVREGEKALPRGLFPKWPQWSFPLAHGMAGGPGSSGSCWISMQSCVIGSFWKR